MDVNLFSDILYLTFLDFLECLAFFFESIFYSLLEFIETTPFVYFSVLVVFVAPLIIYVVDIFIMFSDSTAKLTFDNKEGIQNVITKTDKTVSKVRRKLLNNERERIKAESQIIANEFFKNNPNRMSVTVNGFRFMQEDFEKKHWGNSKRARYTKTFKRDDDTGDWVVSKVSMSSTESFDNSSDEQLLYNFDPD